MKENGFEIVKARQLMQELIEQPNGSTATWSVVERHDGVYVQKEKVDGEIVLYSLPTDDLNSPDP